MKPFFKFIVSLIVLIVCCAIADCIIGVALDKMIDKVPNDGSEIGTSIYAINRMDDPVVIVGSSRASNHYYPSIIADSLSLDTYNIGRQGHYISYQCCLINLILDRYVPDILIWEISMDSLLSDAYDGVDDLKIYYWDNSIIRKVIDDKEGIVSRIKLLSNAYQYNGIAIDVLYKFIKSGPNNDPRKGMVPNKEKGFHVDPQLTYDPGLDGYVDQTRVNILQSTLRRLIDSGVKVFVFDSPQYALLSSNRNLSSESIIRTECLHLGIPIFDSRNMDFFMGHPEMFRDKIHLYEDGAELYSKMAAHQIVLELNK